jgi:hypothetical protein
MSKQLPQIRIGTRADWRRESRKATPEELAEAKAAMQPRTRPCPAKASLEFLKSQEKRSQKP